MCPPDIIEAKPEMGINSDFISLLPQRLNFQMVGQGFQHHVILAFTDPHVPLCLFEGAVGQLTFQSGLIQIIGGLCEFQQHLFVQVYLFHAGLFQFSLRCPHFVAPFAEMKNRDAHIQENGKASFVQQKLVVQLQAVHIIVRAF